MKNIFYIGILSAVLSGCWLFTGVHAPYCSCCESAYTSLDSARACCARNAHSADSASRWFLIAIVNKDLEANQKLGWNIIKDQDIIDCAKRNDYLLIITSKEKLGLPRDTAYLTRYYEVFTGHKTEDIFFFTTVTEDLHPHWHWGANEKKDLILDYLAVKGGP